MNFTYSVVIPTAGNCGQLYPCLQSIVSSSDMKQTEIIVVINGADEQTSQICESFQKHLGESFKFVQLAENEGFCVGTNTGMKLSSGSYVVWLNDDTVVMPGWLEGLRSSIDTQHIYHDKIGLAGPLSNCVAGSQMVKQLAGLQPNNLKDAQAYVDSVKNRYRVTTPSGSKLSMDKITSFLSGFCLMMKREVIDDIGYIDEQFSPGGFCDNDFVLRAIKAGWGCVISEQTFVWHAGSQTLNRLYPEMRGGVKNWAKYIAKHRTNKDNKLVMIQRVKIDNDEQLSVFKKCAFRNEAFVDGVIILSDKSEHKEFSEAACRKIFGKKLLQFATNKKDSPMNEIRDRLFLMNNAHRLDYDWVIVMDHDECFSESTDVTRLKELMNPVNPSVLGYSMLFNNYWRGYQMVRTDGPWGSAFFSRLYRNKLFTPTLRPMYGPEDVGLHCGNRPMSIPEDGFQMCDLVIDHYGYTDRTEIERKHAQYVKLDKTPADVQKHTVGSVNYSHLVNEVGMQVVVPKPFTVSANIMVKNEETNIGMQILQYASFVREFVICDTGSTDSTKEQLDLAGIPYFEMDLDDNFSKVRNELIKRSKSKYIMHIDADEQPEVGYLHKIAVMLNSGPDVCLIGLKTQHRDGRFQVIKQPRIFKNDSRFYYYGRIHETLDEAISKAGPINHADVDLTIFNPGLLKDPQTVKNKLLFYGKLLERELEDHPNNFKACFELGLHYRNFGRVDEAKALLEKCAEGRPEFLRAKLELALIEVNEALEYMDKCEGFKADPELLEVMRNLHGSLAPWRYQPVKLGE